MAQPVGVAGQAVKPPPVPHVNFAGGLAHAGAAASGAIQQATYQMPSSGGSDAATSGPGYGSARADAFKGTPAYARAVVDVFRAQAPAQQSAILHGMAGHSTAEGQIIQRFVSQQRSSNPLKFAGTPPSGELKRAQAAGFPIAAVSPGAIPSLSGLATLAAHAGSDLYHLPGDTVKGLYGIGNELVHGHFGNAFHMFFEPYAKFFADPSKAFGAHPVDTALMFLGPKAVVGRAGGGLARSGALGERAAEAASTAREPLRLPDVGGFKGPPIESRSFSRDVTTAAAQKAIARVRGEKANVAPVASPVIPKVAQNVLRYGAEAKVRRVADEMTAVRQMVGRSERGHQLQVLAKAAPHEAVRNIVSHILQGVIRTPETAIQDIQGEIRRLEPHASQSIRKAAVAQARAQIKDLQRAKDNPGRIPEAFKAAAEIRQHFNASDAYLTRLGLLDSSQALRSKLMPYAMAHMGAKWDAGHGLTVGGKALDTQAILDHLKANKTPDPAYVGHYPAKVAPYRFYSAYKMARGTLGQKRTGEAFRVGAYDHTYAGLAAQGARTAEAITKAGLHDRIVSRFGVKRPDGQDFTPAEAKAAAYAAVRDENGKPIKGGLEYVPMTRAPHSALDHVQNLQSPHELTDRVDAAEIAAVDRAIRDVESRGDSKRNVVLVPKAAVDQFRAQFARQGSLMRSLGRFTQQFRRTVLPYSTHWMLQIGTEAGLRGLIGGVFDPRNLAAGRALMRELATTREGRAVNAETTSAVFYNQDKSLGIYHDANPAVAALKAFPPSRLLLAAHNEWANRIGSWMSGFEHQFRIMGLGKIARQDVNEFTHSWQAAVRLHGQNLAVLADRLKADPNLVAKFGRQIDDIFGKYNKFSPAQRAAIQAYAPFLPWYLSAARFVLWQLPAKSPIASSVLASARQAMRQDVQDGKQQPLDPFAAEQLARLSPFGILRYPTAKGESPVGAALGDWTSVVLPQIEGSISNLRGGNSFGSGPLKGPGGDVKPMSGAAVGSALENALEAFLPGTRYIREAREGTKSSYGTSTILKPQGKGGKGSALNRIFNPFYSFEQAKQTAAGSSGSGISTGGGSSGSGGFSMGGASSGGGFSMGG